MNGTAPADRGSPGAQDSEGNTTGQPQGPRRFELGAEYRNSQLAATGTTVVREAAAIGNGARFATSSPCCQARVHVDAAMWAGTGCLITCRACRWKWAVYLANAEGRLPQLDRNAGHPHISCDRAEWVSRGHGVREYTKKPRRGGTP